MKIFLVAGEASGDVHGSNLVKELLKIYPNAEISGTGGINLKKLGQKQYFTIDDMAIIGFVEVLKKAPFIFKMFSVIEKAIVEENPDIIILVDYPGFNLRLAKKIKKYNKKVVYYIAPQFWVWNYGRIYKLRDYCDLVVSIYPFEMKYFEKEGVNAVYAGNPVTDNFRFNCESRDEFIKFAGISGNGDVIGILPGSRKREIELLMPVFMDAAGEYKDKEFVVSKADNISEELISKYTKGMDNVKIVSHGQYDIMKYSDFLWACSGTVTLEAAILKKPMIIVYSASKINVWLAKRLSNLRNIGLPNIMQGYEFLPEVHCVGEGSGRKEMIISAYEKALSNRDKINQELEKISEQFTGREPSRLAAEKISELIDNKVK